MCTKSWKDVFGERSVFHEDGRKGAFSLLPPCLFEYLAVSVSRHVEEVRSILKKAGAGEGDQEVVKELWKKDFSLWDIQNLLYCKRYGYTGRYRDTVGA